MDKKALIIVANQGFNDQEFTKTKEAIENYGFQTQIASKEKGEAVSSNGFKVSADFALSEVNAEDFDAFVFIGGSGASVYFTDEKVLELVRKANEMKKVLGAICIAPTIFANAGILQGIRATAFESEKDTLLKAGANFSGVSTETQGNIITASGPEASEEFGEKIALVLMSEF